MILTIKAERRRRLPASQLQRPVQENRDTLRGGGGNSGRPITVQDGGQGWFLETGRQGAGLSRRHEARVSQGACSDGRGL